jgi:hypothetical protein
MFRKHLAALALILILPATAVSGPIGGLADHMGGQLLTATVSVGLIDRDMKNGKTDEDFESNMLTAKVTYGVNNKLDLYATMGKANIDGIGLVDDSLEDLYGGGFKFLLFEGVNKTRVTINMDTNFMETSNADYHDISGSVIISKKRGNITPYGGVKASRVEIEEDNGDEWEEDDSTGFFAGADYFVNPNVYFTGEIHVFAENTLYAGVGYNF